MLSFRHTLAFPPRQADTPPILAAIDYFFVFIDDFHYCFHYPAITAIITPLPFSLSMPFDTPCHYFSMFCHFFAAIVDAIAIFRLYACCH
jgi:hypothetical protein